MKKIDVIVAEIGSTTTVVNAFDNLDKDPVFLGQGLAPTTVLEGDVTKGLNNAVENLKENLKTPIKWNKMLATSSAAGGLKMTVHGLVYDMTVKAAREAALGAGAVLHMITAGELTQLDLEKVKEINPNIILLAGGVDYGEKNTAIKNAEHLASLTLECPVIYAGNVAASKEVEYIFNKNNIEITCVENVYPRIDELNIEPTREVIQNVFEKHIVKAPGMEKIYNMITGSIMTTPGAVMNCSKIMKEEIGDLMTVDVGGATTDIHAVTEGSEEISEMLVAPEPTAKRTVEGDLGLYINAENILKACKVQKLDNDFDYDRVEERLKNWVPIPKTNEEKELAALLAEKAVRIAANRHAGEVNHLYGPGGRQTIARGKDLTSIKWIIGTGGALTRLNQGRNILEKLKANKKSNKLFPTKDAKVLIDNDYIMASLGVLAKEHKEGAVKLMKKSLDFI